MTCMNFLFRTFGIMSLVLGMSASVHAAHSPGAASAGDSDSLGSAQVCETAAVADSQQDKPEVAKGKGGAAKKAKAGKSTSGSAGH
jgi:hypothetical protein